MREADSPWRDWSATALGKARLSGDAVTSAISIGELAFRGGSLEQLLDFCTSLGVHVLPLGPAGAHRAGTAQRAYREAGGRRAKLLGDFLIGAEAETLGATLLTRDAGPYLRYFPDLTLITPET